MACSVRPPCMNQAAKSTHGLQRSCLDSVPSELHSDNPKIRFQQRPQDTSGGRRRSIATATHCLLLWCGAGNVRWGAARCGWLSNRVTLGVAIALLVRGWTLVRFGERVRQWPADAE